MTKHKAAAILGGAALLAGVSTVALAQLGTPVSTEQATIQIDEVAGGLEHAWGIDFLPDGSMLVTERPGRLRIVAADGTVSEPITGLPEIYVEGQAGLLDVTLHPDFADNRWVYLSYSEPGEGGNSTAVARGALSADNAALENVEVLFSQQPKIDNALHYGSRIVFDGEGHIFITLGERFTDATREQAQTLDSHLGKIIRLNEDGTVPDDNPFVGQEGALPEIWSIGHRNSQGAAINPATGALWETEHGPMGGDEINIIAAGANYGWPLYSYGVDYDGTPVGTGEAEGEGITAPIYQWTPVIAASGMLFYEGDAFPEWQGDLFVGGLASTTLVRLELDGDTVAAEERLIEDLAYRIRDVAEGPDGNIYIVTDEAAGRILRISPAQ